ncbi:MAG: CDP-glycerol glycerophosphotransferase family protein [Treponema sp.]|nr:CDP-glycerol glycerophosphotransferase family protein [Treponema sp.]
MKEYKNFYRVNRYWVHLRNILWIPLYFISKIIIKKDIYIFGSMSGFSIADNSKYLFINTYSSNYYWITKNKDIITQQILPGEYPIYAYSIKGIILQLTAKKAFYTHKIDDFIPPLIMGARVVALWHGVPFKKIGALEKDEINIPGWKKKIRQYRTRLLPYTYYMYCDEVICPEERFRENYSECFSFVRPEITIQQLPRVLYAKKCVKERKILYAPTYRRYRELSDVLKKTYILSDDFVHFLKYIDVSFVIRPHPIDAKCIETMKLESNIVLDSTEDIYESLTSYSILITDYSSIAYDAEALGIPCLYLSDDIDDYENENGLFSSFSSFLRTHAKSNVLNFCRDIENIFLFEGNK